MNIRPNVDYSTRDYEGFRTDMLNLLVQKIPEYTDLSSSDFGVVLIELLAHGLDILSYYNDKVANEVFLDTAKERENIIMLAKRLGYEIQDSTPSRFTQVFEIIPQEEDFIIPRGFKVKATSDKIEPEVVFELEDELVIPANCTGLETDLEGNFMYSVFVSQGETVHSEIVGTSSGTANQKFYLKQSPVIKDSIVLEVTESNGVSEQWTRVNNFLNSSSTDNHFMLDIDGSNRGVITFGNGKSGRIPPKYLDGIVATYRVGGGEMGNVSPHSIKEMDQKLAGIVRTFNPNSAYELGIDTESAESIRLKAPSQFRATWGAVTLTDFADIIKKDDNIADVVSYLGDSHELDVKVYILPKDYEELSEGSLREIKEKVMSIYRERRALGVDVYIQFAKVKKVDLTLDISIYDNYAKKSIKELVENLISSTYSVGGKKFEEQLHISEIIREIMDVQGVKSVSGIIFDKNEAVETATVSEGEVLAIENLTVNIVGGVSYAQI